VQVVALADYFQERAIRAGQRFNVSAERCFGGPASYQALLETDVEIPKEPKENVVAIPGIG